AEERGFREREVAGEATQALRGEREVELAVLLELLLLRLGEDAVAELPRVGVGERRVGERSELAVHADQRRAVLGHVQIGGARLPHQLPEGLGVFPRAYLPNPFPGASDMPPAADPPRPHFPRYP